MDNRHRAPFPTSFPDSKARRKDVSLSCSWIDRVTSQAAKEEERFKY